MNKSISTLLPFWDPGSLPDNPFIFVLASRRAGKSTLVRELVLNHFGSQNYDFICGLMGNQHTANQYIRNGCIPAKYCHSSYNGDVLKRWFKKSDDLMKKGYTLPKTLFICDDIMRLSKTEGAYTTRGDPWLSKLAVEGRHYRCTTILILHSASLALLFSRNADCVIASPSSLYCGQDFENLAKSYMSADQMRENKTLLKLFKKFDFIVLRYHMGTRDNRELLAYYRVNKQSLDYAK